MELTDISQGRPQDMLRQKFASLKIQPADTMAHINKQIETKWFLYSHHTLFTIETEEGQREGVREVLKMLMNGPEKISTWMTNSLR